MNLTIAVNVIILHVMKGVRCVVGHNAKVSAMVQALDDASKNFCKYRSLTAHKLKTTTEELFICEISYCALLLVFPKFKKISSYVTRLTTCKNGVIDDTKNCECVVCQQWKNRGKNTLCPTDKQHCAGTWAPIL